MRRITKAAAALILVASAMATVGATSASAQDANAIKGCPSGAVCIYPQDAGFNNGRPSHAFFSFGAHNLENQFGNHLVLNNQIDDATARLCGGFDGRGDCTGNGGRLADRVLEPGESTITDLTPINSILLVRKDSRGSRRAE